MNQIICENEAVLLCTRAAVERGDLRDRFS